MHAKKIRRPSTELLGIILKIAAGIVFAAMSAVIKYLDTAIPLGEVVFARSFIALFPLVIFLLATSDFPAGLKTQHPWKHFLRCFLGTLAMFFAFASLRYLPIAEATAISYLSPVILVILSYVWLKEKVSPRRIGGVSLGLLGLLLMTTPHFTAHNNYTTLIGILLALASALLIAGALLQVRQLSIMGENPAAITFYFALTSSVTSLLTALNGWIMPTTEQFFCLISIGLLGGIAQILMTLSLKYAEASALATYDYLSVLWAVIIGLLVFDEVPNAIFWIAMPVILLGAVIAKPKNTKR